MPIMRLSGQDFSMKFYDANFARHISKMHWKPLFKHVV